MHTAVRRLAPVFAAVLTLGSLSACAEDEPTGSSAPTTPTPSATGSTSPDPDPSPSPTDEPDEVEEPEESPEEREGGLRGGLLTASELPGFNETFTWVETATSNNEGEPLAGGCHKFAMTSIGAFKVVRRLHEPAVAGSPGTSASQLLARFADEATAQKAYATLQAWHDQCAATLGPAVEVGPFVPLELNDATGGWYLITGDDAFEAQGFARNDDTIIVLTLSLAGQDYNYAPGQEPMVAALQAAAEILD